MKKLLNIFMLLFIVLSCRKQELAPDNPMIGKWQVSTLTVETKCKAVPSVPTFKAGKPFKKAIMEIFSSGEIRVQYGGETEKLTITRLNQTLSTAKFYDLPNAVKKYDCKVRDRKGKVFDFHFYFSEDSEQMIGTYWTPKHPYHSTSIINSTTVNCSWGAMQYQGYDDEFFAVYKKL